MITVDKAKAIELLEKVVADKGADYKDPNSVEDALSCSYVNDAGEPLCIIGHVLVNELGVPGRILSTAGEIGELIQLPVDQNECDWTGEPGVIEYDNFVAGGTARYEEVEFTPEAVAVFGNAQWAQDGGNTWGEALDAAKR
jgi:hypothetical protein